MTVVWETCLSAKPWYSKIMTEFYFLKYCMLCILFSHSFLTKKIFPVETGLAVGGFLVFCVDLTVQNWLYVLHDHGWVCSVPFHVAVAMQRLMDPDVCNKAAFLMTAEMFALHLGEAVKSKVYSMFSPSRMKTNVKMACPRNFKRCRPPDWAVLCILFSLISNVSMNRTSGAGS